MSQRSKSADITGDMKAERLTDMQRSLDNESNEKCMRVRLMSNKTCTVYERSVSQERSVDADTKMKWLSNQTRLHQNASIRSNTLNLERQVFSDKIRRLRAVKAEQLRQVKRDSDIENIKRKEQLDWEIRHHLHEKSMKSLLTNNFRQNVRRAETSLAIQRQREKENHILELKKTQQLFEKQRQAELAQNRKALQRFQRQRGEDELRERLQQKEAEIAYNKELDKAKSKEWHRVQKERANNDILISKFESTAKLRSKSVDLSPTSRVITSPPPPKPIKAEAYNRLLGRTITEREHFVENSLSPSESPTQEGIQLQLLALQSKSKRRIRHKSASPPPYDRTARGWH
eukprot:TRINITY_DN34359_c0_g1_i1.p1 TRINITY_DN34359_c0_g1~~TRINITY_DN34359_c0_g1_i1.p1  ORF type:complete len:355 (+),score=77.95 TRINITY_DN34359_c0_g1_i1:32-1066(+)